MTGRRIGELVGLGAILVGVSGCPVPQQPGAGKQAILTEPRTGAQYFLYLPEAYIKNNGRHPLYPERRWPLVMTFHGMKPYDTWDRQAHEWEYEADNYGYIICAPWLQTSDSFMEYPLRSEHSYVLKDKERVIAIMDHVFATTRADPKAVLSTSFSCGGYMAHYFPNRFPKRFTCIATRLSNFSADVLLEQTVPLYRQEPVALFIGDGDFPACKSESEQAVAWYQARGFKVTGKTIDNLGHQRIPQCAAAFFAEQMGIEPIYPERAARTLALVRMRDFHPTPAMLAAVMPRQPILSYPPSSALAARGAAPSTPGPVQVARVDTARGVTPTNTNAREPDRGSSPISGAAVARVSEPSRGNWLDAPERSGASRAPEAGDVESAMVSGSLRSIPRTPPRNTSVAAPRTTPPRRSEPATAFTTPRRTAEPFRPRDAGPRNYPTDRLTRQALWEEPRRPVREPVARVAAAPPPAVQALPARRISRGDDPNLIRLTGADVGKAPLYVLLAINLPAEKLRGADIWWMDNGMWVSDEPRFPKILDTPGQHRISVTVVTRDQEEFRGVRKIQVLGNVPDVRGTMRAGTN